MRDELDLYAGGGIPWKRIAVTGGIILLVLSVAGYRWVTTSTPITRDRALELFHEQQAEQQVEQQAGPGRRGAGKQRGAKAPKPRAPKKAPAAPRAGSQAAPAAVPEAPVADAESPARPAPAGPASARVAVLPQEGVYSWATSGYEEVGGARRKLPEESQRVLTREGNQGWTQHHYFSEEREVWTQFRVNDTGAHITYQRNKVSFGPVTNDATVAFAPPMLVGPADLEVGQRWKGSWSGKTYGTYAGRTFERRVLRIGGTDVETFGVEVLMEMKGEISGEVDVRVWIAPKYGMTVREHYVQDVQADVGTYHGEWTITLRSLRPRR